MPFAKTKKMGAAKEELKYFKSSTKLKTKININFIKQDYIIRKIIHKNNKLNKILK